MKTFESLLLSYLLNSLWQVPLLWLAGSLAARALQKAGAAAEHRLWVCVLLLQSFLPACSLLPWDRLSALFAWGNSGSRMGDARVAVVMGAGTGLNALRLPAELLALIAVSYSAVCAFLAARFLWRGIRLSSLRRMAVCVRLTGDAAACWTQCSQLFGVEHPALASSSQIFGPVTLGCSRKLLLLPANMLAGLPHADLRAIIAHEFAHMRRNDFLKNLIYETIALPVGYHPLFWPIRERIMQTREMVCDEMAANITGRSNYARSLLRLASLLVRGTSNLTPHAIGIFDANAFERRLMRLTRKPSEISGLRRAAILTTCAAFGLGTCVSALALRMHVDAAAPAAHNSLSESGKPLTVSPGEMAGNKISGPNPKYPEDAKKAKVQGKVVLGATIGKDGKIKHLRVVSGPNKLRKSSLDAVRQWTYKPYLLNGQPVEVETTINVIYSLQR
jgi:TonB family protein